MGEPRNIGSFSGKERDEWLKRDLRSGEPHIKCKVFVLECSRVFFSRKMRPTNPTRGYGNKKRFCTGTHRERLEKRSAGEGTASKIRGHNPRETYTRGTQVGGRKILGKLTRGYWCRSPGRSLAAVS